jgi:hypothetical protein
MLFDLRAPGRRRTIQVVYVILAVLMGGGLIFFGIGGNTSGGLLDAFKDSGGGTSAEQLAQKKVDGAEKTIKVRPQDAAAWATLTKAQFQQAGITQNDQTGEYTSDGIKHLREAARSWDRYTQLSASGKPDATLATLMTQAFLPSALNKPDEAVKAWEIVVDSRPASTGLYSQLAQLAYSAGQSRKGDLAAAKAVDLAPKDQRKDVKAQLDALKAQSAQGAATSGSPGSG